MITQKAQVSIFILLGILILVAIGFTILAAGKVRVGSAVAQGCCCDPSARNGSFLTGEQCSSLNFVFVGAPPDLTTNCNVFCNASFVNAPSCGNPNVRPAPKVVFSPVAGKKAVRFEFTLPCPSYFVSVERCMGAGCSDFTLVAQVPGTSFIDEDASLEFNRDYTYKITAHDKVYGPSDPAFVSVSLGDLECWDNPGRTFCLSSGFYARFEDYLTRFGYGLSSPLEYSSDFFSAVGRTFTAHLNQPWQCSNNTLIPAAQSCSSGQFCVADEAGARCVSPGNCESKDPFGLFSTKSSCEAPYCFFDKSDTFESCFSCSPDMTCNNYKTQSACESDACGTGACQWKTVLPGLTGVCIDPSIKNCAFCSPQQRESPLWNMCTEEKSSALSTSLYPCFFDKDVKLSKSCDEASCADYTQSQCGSQGIRLAPNNSIVARSSDPCNIGVCEYHSNTGCVKNADGSTGASLQDCRFGNNTCELDYFPPVTSILANGSAGRIEFLNIYIFDKESKTVSLLDHTGKSGYLAYVCVKSSQNPCTDARLFTPISSHRLILSNKMLKDGNKTIAQLVAGNNALAFYSRDAANNVEIVRETSIFACDNCNGPILLNISVSDGLVLGNNIYTSNSAPVFTFSFDSPSTINFAELKNAFGAVPLRQLTTGSRQSHQFSAAGLGGEYELSLNAFNERSIYMDPRAVAFVVFVNASAPYLEIYPDDGSIVLASPVKSLNISLNFSGNVILKSVMLSADSFDPFAKHLIPRDITALLAKNKTSFFANIPNVLGGSYVLFVDAQSYTGIPIRQQSRFFVASEKPKMRVIEPAFGLSASPDFNVTVETPIPAQCAYVYNTPSAPSQSDFAFFNKFMDNGTKHFASGFLMPAETVNLHVYCDFDSFGVRNSSFEISLDSEPPYIVNAFSEPGIVSERFVPEADIFMSGLKVQLDKPGFCKYSAKTDNFGLMEGLFPGFDELPKETLAVDINVTSVKDYSFFVVCKGKNQLLTEPVKIDFSVDLSLPLNISSSTPQGFATNNFSIGVVANKRVVCYFGERADDISKCMGSCRTLYSHNQNMLVSGEGQYKYFVKCSHPSGSQSPVLEIPVFVDTSPPVVSFVNDDSALETDRNITWSLNRLRVSFKGEDQQSGIAYYLISVQNPRTRQFVVKDKEVFVLDGSPVYIELGNSSLIDKESYIVSVHAVNKVGLKSEPLTSDGVFVDNSQRPPACSDGEQSAGETDIDCGGMVCDGCLENKNCSFSSDCDTKYCVSGVCKIASCSDGVMNGVESDIDCGGKYSCSKCATAASCRVDSDCLSDYCAPVQKKCMLAPPCADKKVSEGETDVDCGGSCNGCELGKSCEENTDCASGVCTGSVCGSAEDSDFDGVADSVDLCPGTSASESVDEKGCSSSQVSSLDDGISDKWRLDYFSCIDCDAASADNDFDNDGLTNSEEFKIETSPVEEDSDSDGWADGDEVEEGTDPLSSTNYPESGFGIVLWILFALLIVGGIIYGGYLGLQFERMQKQEKPVERKINTGKLDLFARKPESEETGWLSIDELKPPKEEKIVEILKDPNPINRLRGVVKHLSSDEQQAIASQLDNLNALSKRDRDALFDKLKITASYYKGNKEKIKKELK